VGGAKGGVKGSFSQSVLMEGKPLGTLKRIVSRSPGTLIPWMLNWYPPRPETAVVPRKDMTTGIGKEGGWLEKGWPSATERTKRREMSWVIEESNFVCCVTYSDVLTPPEGTEGGYNAGATWEKMGRSLLFIGQCCSQKINKVVGRTITTTTTTISKRRPRQSKRQWHPSVVSRIIGLGLEQGWWGTEAHLYGFIISVQ